MYVPGPCGCDAWEDGGEVNRGLWFFLFFLGCSGGLCSGEDRNSEKANDLVTPRMVEGVPGPGKRVRQVAPEYVGKKVFHSVYLPVNWKVGKKYPVIIEYTGNFHPASGSSGQVKDANLGYGLSGGRDFIWVVLPFVEKGGEVNAVRWWGDVEATVSYCKRNVPKICREFGGDLDRVFLCGFSRGAIGASYIGLRDDEIAKMWRGIITHDHFDGDRKWKYPESDRQSALKRLRRFRYKGILVMGHGGDFLKEVVEFKDVTYVKPRVSEIFEIPEGRVVSAHTDLWMHRESEWRQAARDWLRERL